MPESAKKAAQLLAAARAHWALVRARRDLLLLFGGSTVLNLCLWIIMLVWFRFDLIVPLVGTLVLLLNGALAVVFLRKDAIIIQSLGVTAGIVQLLLVIFVIRTGTLGL